MSRPAHITVAVAVVVVGLGLVAVRWWGPAKVVPVIAMPGPKPLATTADPVSPEAEKSAVVGPSAGSVADAGDMPGLWSLIPPPPEAEAIEQRSSVAAHRINYVRYEPAAVGGVESALRHPGGGRWAVALSDGRTVHLVIEHTVATGPDRLVSSGSIAGVRAGRFRLAVAAGHLSVSLSGVVPGELRLRTVAADTAGSGLIAQLYEVDPTLAGDCRVVAATERPALAELIAADDLRAAAAASASAASVAAEVGPLASGQAVVDVLLVYTAAARAAIGSTASMVAEIDLAVAQVNEDLAASGVTARIRLAGTLEVDYPEDAITTGLSGWQTTSLGRLAGNIDGYMDEVHAARDAVGADVVCLALRRSDPATSGVAYVLEDVGRYTEPFYAFAVVNAAGLADATVLSHELGHTLGCAHDRENAGTTPARGYHGAYPDSYGFRATATDTGGTSRTIRSIMAYSPGTRLRYFSSPAVTISSYALGAQTVRFATPVTLGASEATSALPADNARTIERTAFQVAGYRLVPDAATAGQLVNVSTLAWVGSGDQMLIGGFVVTGTETQTLLVRAPGPAIGAEPFRVTGALADPLLTLTAIGTGTTVNTNDNWGTSADHGLAVAAAGAAAGAFPFTSGSRDAALVATVPPGSYSAAVTGAGGAEGYALVEVYAVGLDGPTRLVNISTRAYASESKPITAGFVVKADPTQPTARKRMFVRVRGPSLVNYGLPAGSVMPDPALELYDASAQLVYVNNDWDAPSADLDGTSRDTIAPLVRGQVDQPSEAAVFAAARQIGANDMLPQEPAAVLDLPPGLYTMIVRPGLTFTGASTAGGVAIVEVFELTE